MAKPTLILPDGNIITEDDIVVLRRFPGMTWTINRGWYTYMDKQANGWYFQSIPDGDIMPVVDDDLIGIVIEQSNYISPDCGCNTGNNNSSNNNGSNNSGSNNGNGNGGNGNNNNYPYPPYYPPSNNLPQPCCPPPHTHTKFTETEKLQLDRAFITVNSIAERDALVENNKYLPHGKIVKVNSTQDRTTKYFTWNQIAQEWDIETFGIGDLVTKEECANIVQDAITEFVQSTTWKQLVTDNNN